MDRYRNEYNNWLKQTKQDSETQKALKALADSKDELADAFCRDLSFGTGGLRGILGVGTNRMNPYTVARTSRGLASHIRINFPGEKQRIAISYDSRLQSEVFSRIAAKVFAENEITVYLFPQLMPTPCLSFAVRELHCLAGVMITASHNSYRYNGYKVYGSDGCQITDTAAAKIQKVIEQIPMFEDGGKADFQKEVQQGRIRFIEDAVITSYIDSVKKQSIHKNEELDKHSAIVYTPLNGTGRKPVLRVLREMGYEQVMVVKEQEQPDGYFPTCPVPNPEKKEAMSLAIQYAVKIGAELVLATDPDCDRVGIAVRDSDGEYQQLSGNEIGLLLFDYICAGRTQTGTMPDQAVAIKTIVTSDMAEKIAEHYGVKLLNVLTGFKYIGEQIGCLEKAGQAEHFIFGFEESCGYLSGTYVRDKDAVDGVLLICEMFAFYKYRNMTLSEKMQELYNTYGYTTNTLHSYQFEGQAGQEKIQEILDSIRKGLPMMGSLEILQCIDYQKGIEGLPKANVLKLILKEGCSVVIRPSGTEPLLKVYICVCTKTRDDAEVMECSIIQVWEQYFNCIY